MALATKQLPDENGLSKRRVVIGCNINDDSQRIQLVCVDETLSPTGAVINRTEPVCVIIENKPAVLDGEGNEITPANPAYDNLKNSQVGQTICGMIQDKLNQ